MDRRLTSPTFKAVHPLDPGLSEARDRVPRHHHAARATRAPSAAPSTNSSIPYAGGKVDKVAGIEARGFILGGAVAHQLSAGFVPIRKKGKLPHATVRIAYSLEYGVDEMEIHADAIGQGERVILVDDLIATGGTAVAAVELLRQIGADVVAACFVIDLPDLGGAEEAARARRRRAHARELRGALTTSPACGRGRAGA